MHRYLYYAVDGSAHHANYGGFTTHLVRDLDYVSRNMSHVRGTSGVMLKQALSRAFDREGTRFLAVRAEYESRPGPASTTK